MAGKKQQGPGGFARMLNRLVDQCAEAQVAAASNRARRASIETLMRNGKLKQYRTPQGHLVRRVSTVHTKVNHKLLKKLLGPLYGRCFKRVPGMRLEIKPALAVKAKAKGRRAA